MTRVRDLGVETISNRLIDREMAVAVCGGIGAIEVVKIIRELRRHGATVTAFMTPDSLKFITALSVEWACDRSVVLELSARSEHLLNFDSVVVVPATLNTVSKVALGICDNAVSLLIATQLSKRGRVLFVPAMNDVMWEHPLISKYQNQLIEWGAEFLENSSSEGRLKVCSPELITSTVLQSLEKKNG